MMVVLDKSRTLEEMMRPTGPLGRFFAIMIVISVISFIVETEPLILAHHGRFFFAFNILLGTIFTVEYIIRLYIAPRRGMSRLRYALTPMALLDVVCLIPFYVVGFSDAFVVRIMRIFRLAVLGRLGRYSAALQTLGSCFYERRYELLVSAAICVVCIFISGTGIYLVEGERQPEWFGSIPRAMYWSSITLTTIGYGDVYPITVMGRVLAIFSAICGVAIVAMPAGILAAAFTEAFQRGRERVVAISETTESRALD